MAHSEDSETRRSNQAFIQASMDTPLLSREREHQLAQDWAEHHDEAALHELVRAYGRLVVAMATRFRHYGLPLADLIQEGNVGLMLAAERFDPAREVRFSTYAGWWVRSAMQDFVLRNWSIVRTGVTAAHKSLFFNLRRLRATIAGQTGEECLNEDSRQQIATALGVGIKDVRAMEQRLSASDQSLNTPISSDSDDDWQGFLVDDRPNPEEVTQLAFDNCQRSKWLRDALMTLSERERTIICERRLGDESITLEEIGRDLGVSKERVRQLEVRAMSKLKVALLRSSPSRADLIAEE